MLLEIFIAVVFPIALLIAISLFFFLYPETLEEIGFGKREVGLLIVGSASTMFFDLPLFFYQNYFLALNIGGALIPIVLAFYFIKTNSFSFVRMAGATFLVALATYMVTVVTPSGVVSYFPFYFLPPILSFLIALLLYFRHPKACAFSYTTSTLGVIIGGDFSHLPELFTEPFIGSMGGAGIYDMIYLAGLISFFLSFIPIEKKRLSKEERREWKIRREAYYAGRLAGVGGDYKGIVKVLTGKSVDEIRFYRLLTELNKPIRKKYAAPWKRIIAFLLDSFIIIPSSLAFFLIYNSEEYVLLSLFLFFQIVYFTGLEWYFGATVGKAVMDIEVRNVAGEKADFITVFTRNIIRILEFFMLFYMISLLLMILTPKMQRLGDLIADSIVMEAKA